MKTSDILFLASAFLSFLFSIYLWFLGNKEAGLFVGIWVPSILSGAVLIKLIQGEKSKSKS
jgi:hypothetical protein